MDQMKKADKMIFHAMSNLTIRSVMEKLYDTDAYTFWHSVSVARMSLVLGLTYGLKDKELTDLMYAALFHEIGMVKVTEEIKRDRTPLTMIPKDKAQKHPVIGAEMIANIGCFSSAVVTAIRCHHENYDGSGIIYHEAGEKANLYSRIIRICDIYDAMADDHVYTSEVVHKRILNVITAARGKELDPSVVSLFLFVKDPGKVENRGASRIKRVVTENFQLDAC